MMCGSKLFSFLAPNEMVTSDDLSRNLAMMTTEGKRATRKPHHADVVYDNVDDANSCCIQSVALVGEKRYSDNCSLAKVMDRNDETTHNVVSASTSSLVVQLVT